MSEFVPVPVEPTPEMCIAGGIAANLSQATAETYVDCADACYKAMLAARPADELGELGELEREISRLNAALLERGREVYDLRAKVREMSRLTGIAVDALETDARLRESASND